MQNDENCTPLSYLKLLRPPLATYYIPTRKNLRNLKPGIGKIRQGISENVLIAYFDMQSRKNKSSTLGSIYEEGSNMTRNFILKTKRMALAAIPS
jgi:hypothetical protein